MDHAADGERMTDADGGPVFLTTREVAELLRLKERKVYDLASSGALPCSRATGKLLFSRAAVEAWVAGASGRARPAPAAARARPNVVLGSHDPLLDWALRESGAGMAVYFDGSADGLGRFANGEGAATGLHVLAPGEDPALDGAWNIAAARAAGSGAVLVSWARRRRGLLRREGDPAPSGLAGLGARVVAARQPGAGAQGLLTALVARAGGDPAALRLTEPQRSEADAALAVVEGRADVAFGLEVLARAYRLAFTPVVEERYDLLVDRRAWFEPPWRRFAAFCGSKAFRARAAEQRGYDVSELFDVRWNGA